MPSGYALAVFQIVVLEEISKLTYLLGRGSISAERSHFLLGKYVEQSEQSRTHLGEWHTTQVERLKIDLDKERRSKSGFERILVVAATPVLLLPVLLPFEEKFKYRQLEQGVAHEIGTQANIAIESRGELSDVYDEDVEIIIKDGKLFYLHDAPDGEAVA